MQTKITITNDRTFINFIPENEFEKTLIKNFHNTKDKDVIVNTICKKSNHWDNEPTQLEINIELVTTDFSQKN